MVDLGIDIDSFNPKILFVFRKNTREGQSHSHDFLPDLCALRFRYLSPGWKGI